MPILSKFENYLYLRKFDTIQASWVEGTLKGSKQVNLFHNGFYYWSSMKFSWNEFVVHNKPPLWTFFNMCGIISTSGTKWKLHHPLSFLVTKKKEHTSFPKNTLIIHQQHNINCILKAHSLKNLFNKFPMLHNHERCMFHSYYI